MLTFQTGFSNVRLKIWIRQGSMSETALVQDMCFHHFNWLKALVHMQWLVQFLKEPLTLSPSLRQMLQLKVFEDWYHSQRLSFNFYFSLWMPSALFVIILVFSVISSFLYLIQVSSRLSRRSSSFCTSSARASVSSKNRIYHSLPSVLIFPSCFFQVIRYNMLAKSDETA